MGSLQHPPDLPATFQGVIDCIGVKLESVQCVKDLGVTIELSLTFFHQGKDDASKANTRRMLLFYKQKLILQE